MAWPPLRPNHASPSTGPDGFRPRVGLSPKRPLAEAGMRIEPPPSEACAIGTIPEATAAAAPPEDPPDGSGRIPRVGGLAVKLGLANRSHAELGGVGLPHDDESRGLETVRQGPVVIGNEVGHRSGPVGQRSRPICQSQVLQQEGNPGERSLSATPGLHTGLGPVVHLVDDGVE